MLFADEPRFYADKQGIAVNDESLLVGRSMTEEHLGPGSYFTAKNDDRRGHWTPRSPDKNARPMSATFRNRDVNHSITDGILVDEVYVRQPSANRDLPGPGYYTPRERKSSKGFSFNSASEMEKARKNMSVTANLVSSPKSPRLTPGKATMRNDVLCYSHGQDLDTGGPGYYYKNESGLLKKSFNVRVGRKEPIKSPRPGSGGSASPSKNFRSSTFPMSPIQKQPSAFVTPVQHR